MFAQHCILLAVAVFGFVVAAPSGERKKIGRPPTGYVEYHPGTGLNVLLAAPHGGSLTPTSIPDRTAGCWDSDTSSCIWTHTCGTPDSSRCAATTVKDLYTLELTQELRQALCNRFGTCPGTVINLLHRIKFDANRPKDEATFGVPEVEAAFDEYHEYLTQEKAAVTGMGLFIDVHGHGHSIQRAELGYLISGSALDSGQPINPNTTSIRSLAAYRASIGFEELLRGATSFGAFMEAEGFAAVPSASDPGPGGQSYFSGGYNTQVYGSVNGGLMDGIQIESPRSFRELPARVQYVQALVNTIENYLTAHYPAVVDGKATSKV